MLTEGMFVADRYEIVGKIGAGGMSDVYKARDQVLGRFVAVKVLKQEFSEDVNFLTKFRSEAQSAAGLEHPNIVNIYDVGSENGMYFIVMEYVEGITLKTYIEKKGKLTYKEAVSIAIQVGRGIEAAHNRNIVHRDIKPQNIMISSEGKVKVTDFGIARASNSTTIHADIMGSVHYTSPEQARNGYVNGKSDIYSLGIVLYEMVTGRVPFDGDSTVAVAIQHLQEEMTPPSAYTPDLPVSLEKIILKCTQKNPDRRYESISGLLGDLKQALITPHEDFVVIAPVGQERTPVVPAGTLDTSKQQEQEPDDPEEDSDEDEDEEEEEGFLNPKMEKAVTIMGIVAAIIIVIIIAGIIASAAGLFRFGSGKQDDNPGVVDDDTVTMISVLGMTETEAKEALNKIGLGIRVDGTVASEEYAEGEIVSQDVEEDEDVEKNTTIHVTVSSGVGEFEVPYVIGMTDADAKKAITDAGLTAKREFDYDDTVPYDEVISQSPEQGKKVKKGDTVTYVVSKGVEEVKVPSSEVIGKTEAEARKILEDAGFTVAETSSYEYDDTVEKGSVVKLDNTSDYMAKGSSITMTVSLGKEITYYYEHTYKKPVVEGVKSSYVKATATLKTESGKEYSVKVTDKTDEITVYVTGVTEAEDAVLTITWRVTYGIGYTAPDPEPIELMAGDFIRE